MKRAILPISADPLTNGHLELIHLGLEIFDELIIALLVNNTKEQLFTLEEKRGIIEKVISFSPDLTKRLQQKKIHIVSHTGLLIELATSWETRFVIRGIRNSKDLDYENMLKRTYQDQLWQNEEPLKFVYLQTSAKVNFISSTLAKSICLQHGNTARFVPLFVKQKMEKKMLGQKKIIVTGGIASGKTTCCKILAKNLEKYDKATIIDFDEIVGNIYEKIEHGEYPKLANQLKVLLPKTDKIKKQDVAHFIETINKYDALIFLQKLQTLFGPYIRNHFLKKLSGKSGFILLDMPMAIEYQALSEAGNFVVFTEIEKQVQLERLVKRNNYKKEEAEKRIMFAGENDEKKDAIQREIKKCNYGQFFSLQPDDKGGFVDAKMVAEKIHTHFQNL